MGSASRAASCLCCPLRFLLSCLCSILVSLLVTIGVLALVLYFIFRPHEIAATVDSASLATFSLSPTTSTLAYNLTVAVTVRNPNRRVGLYYDDVEALAFYKAQRFGYDPLDSFYQGAQETTQLKPEFHGSQVLQGDVVDAADFGRQEAGGNFAINVGLNAKLRVKVWSLKVRGPKAKIICKLLVPAPGATNNGATLQPTDCKVRF